MARLSFSTIYDIQRSASSKSIPQGTERLTIMPSSSRLDPYMLSPEKLVLLQRCFESPPPIPGLQLYPKRPRPSELRTRVTSPDGGISTIDPTSYHPPEVMEEVLQSIQRTWDDFYDGSVGPNEFMRSPFGALYEVVTIAGKGRGMLATRDIEAGETILQDTPVLLLPYGSANVLIFLTLPKLALEAILLLHNNRPNVATYSSKFDIPLHRLLDQLDGILSTNCFSTPYAACGSLGVLLLTGSLFNHSNTPNVTLNWNKTIKKMVFTASGAIKKGDELVVDYVSAALSGAERTEALRRDYGII